MARKSNLETVEQFIEWANKRSKRDRFILNSYPRWNDETNERDEEFYIEVAGTGSKWRSNSSFGIPLEVGVALKTVWKTSEYGSFVGVRGIKSILEIVAGSDAVSNWKSIQAEVEAREAKRVRINRAHWVREHLESALGSLSQANGTLISDFNLNPVSILEIEHRINTLEIMIAVMLGDAE